MSLPRKWAKNITAVMFKLWKWVRKLCHQNVMNYIMPFPDNLNRAHAEGERIRIQSVAAIEASEPLSFHAHVIERTANLLYSFGHDGPIKNDDDRVIRVLGFRGFNDIMTAANLLLCGYYLRSNSNMPSR